MVYINKKTGAVVETDGTVNGGDWEPQEAPKKRAKKRKEGEESEE